MSPVSICCFVAPADVDLLLRSPASSPDPRHFWRWRVGESRRAGLLPAPADTRRRRRRARASVLTLLAALTVAASAFPTPTAHAWQRFHSGNYELLRLDEGEGPPTLPERVADAVADASDSTDFLTVPLQLSSDTSPQEEAALIAPPCACPSAVAQPPALPRRSLALFVILSDAQLCRNVWANSFA